MASDFSAELRVVTCDACGAPLRLTVDAIGPVAVDCVCGLRLERAPRTLSVPPPTPLSEAERWHRLRAQERTVERASSTFARIGADGLEEAVARWVRLRTATACGDDRAGEDLLQLTFAIQNDERVSFDTRRIRAMYESALEAVRSPSLRAVFLGLLASSACRLGDARGAEGWLRVMDSRSADLRADSAWRNAKAVYFTALDDLPRVLEVLGVELGTTPFHAQYRLFCVVLRANAHAKLGDVSKAREELGRLPRPDLARGVADKWPSLALFTG
jgi:hypothetical protein